MLDLHSHILPGVDDGSRSLDESIQMARMYVENGYDSVIVTPHYYDGVYDSTRETNLAIMEELQEILSNEGIPLKLYLGNELYYSRDLPILLKEKRVSAMNSTSFVLVEFPMTEPPLFLEELVYQLQMAGVTPIFAHVERYRFVQKEPDALLPYLKKGCIMQMNLSSLRGESEKAKKTAEGLLARQMIQLVGTDSHQSEWRSPDVSDVLTSLREMISTEYFHEIVVENPYRVLDNKRIAIHHDEDRNEQAKPKKKGFFKRLFSSGGAR